MELKYKLTQDEYIHKSVHVASKIREVRNRKLFAPFFLAALAGMLVWMLGYTILIAALSAIFGAVLGIALAEASYKARLASTFKLLNRNEDVTVELNEGGVYVAVTHIRSQVDWEAIQSVEEDGVGFYLNYEPHQTLFVPRRVFATAADAQQFWALAQEYSRFARHASNTTQARI